MTKFLFLIKKSSFVIVFSMMLCGVNIHAQSDSIQEESLSVNVDLVSRYVWRGLQLSQSPAVQPAVTFSKGGFLIGTWGSSTFSPEPLQEVDLFAGYSIGYFSLLVTDYYNPMEPLQDGDYFEWESGVTRHILEGTFTFDGPDAFPVQLLAGIFFYGDDLDEAGDNQYSTYIELNKTWQIGSVQTKPFVGITPATGYYSSNGFQVVNLGVALKKELRINDKFSLPLSTSFIVNPHLESVNLVVGIGL